jgi:hypothetical protein
LRRRGRGELAPCAEKGNGDAPAFFCAAKSDEAIIVRVHPAVEPTAKPKPETLSQLV